VEFKAGIIMKSFEVEYSSENYIIIGLDDIVVMVVQYFAHLRPHEQKCNLLYFCSILKHNIYT